MTAHRGKSRRTGRGGWGYRLTDPLTGKRSPRTVWFAECREADAGFKEFLEGRERRKLNLPDYSGWQMPFMEIVKRFLAEAPLSTERRRAHLRQILERNELGLQVGSDLANIGKLTVACR